MAPPVPEVEAFLSRYPDTAGVELLLPDLNGIFRGKRVSVRQLGTLYRRGISFPGTGVLVDSRGALIETLGAGISDGDPDFLCRPVPGTLVPVPWAIRPLGQCLLGMYKRTGEPWFADPRHVLARVLARFSELGLTPVVAVEYEFYLVEEVAAERPRPRRGRIPGTRRRAEGPQVYSVEDLHELEPFFAAVAATAAAQGIPASDILSEYGSGQFEVNLGHVPDALAACDHALFLRRLIRGVAGRHDLAATFMAKPFAELDGSGMHVHVSLLDAAGRNVFGTDEPILRYAVGGMLATLPESLAIFAPNANSCRRIRPGAFAPVAPNWGENHRHVAIRLPLADAGNRRFEHRMPGADANPYLAVAAILAGAHHGIVNRIAPPPPVEEGMAAPATVQLASRWEQVLDRFEAGRVLPDYLGEEFCRVWGTARRFEADAYHAQVPVQDYEWYLGSI